MHAARIEIQCAPGMEDQRRGVRRAWEATRVLAGLKALAGGSTPLCGAKGPCPRAPRALYSAGCASNAVVSALLGHSRLPGAFEDQDAAAQRH